MCYYTLAVARMQVYPGVAKFGIALEWGSRGLEFESRHSDQKTRTDFCSGFFFFNIENSLDRDDPGSCLLVTKNLAHLGVVLKGFFMFGVFESPTLAHQASDGAYSTIRMLCLKIT